MNKKKNSNISRTLYYFWKALMQCKVRTLVIMLLVPAWIFVSNVVVPYGTSEIIGKLSGGDFEIAHYTGLLLLTILSMAVNNLGISRLLDWLDWTIDAIGGEYLAKLAFSAVINQSMTFHSNKFSGSLTSAASKFSRAFIILKSNFVWDLFPLVLTVAYAVIVAGLICPPFALILVIYTVVYTTIVTVTYYKTRKVDEEIAKADNHQTGQLADAITNEMSVKSYARERMEEKRFARATAATKKATYATARVAFWRNVSMNTVNLITFAGLLILIVMSHDLFGLTIANMVFLYSISNSLLSSVWMISAVLRTVNRTLGDAKEMVEILDAPLTVEDKSNQALAVKDAEIQFSHIAFQHEGKKTKLFEDFSLVIPAGKSVGLVGVSGSGKSTLTKLLLRFADVSSGQILVDGQDIRDVTQRSLREAIAYVPQESSLFHRSVYENIAYGKVGAKRSEVLRAAKLANAEEFIEGLPDKYDTLVGERGVKLSGGQRQRIAIARAILKDAPILVLDEATSALDSESEAMIQGALANLMKGRTSLVVAHRLSTIAGLDMIVVLKDGKIVEQGSHHELLNQGGEYAKLWSRQSGAFLDEK